MTTSRDVLASSPDTCPGQISWDYDRAEIRPMASCNIEIAPILVYVIGLVTMLALSAAYNMWSVLPAKWFLCRFDHSVIYLLIAGTYTPFLARMKNVLASAGFGSRALAFLQLVSRTCR
jgi:predicted membrane channel-forming protein YqfA (hemolysin III family)